MLSYCARIVVFIFLYILSATSVFATAPQITAFPQSVLSLDAGFTISATMSGLSKNAIYRLRIALAQSGTSSYFGSTYNGVSWYNGTPAPIIYSNFFSITTDLNGSWNGDILGKIDSDDPNFTTGSGNYDLKIGRYTQTGSTATWSDPVTVAVVVPPTPTPTITPVPTSTVTPTPPPTSTPKPINTPVLSSTQVPTIKVQPTVLLYPSFLISPSLIPRVTSTSAESIATPSGEVNDNVLGVEASAAPKQLVIPTKTMTFVIPWSMWLGLLLLVTTCGILGYLIYRHGHLSPEHAATD